MAELLHTEAEDQTGNDYSFVQVSTTAYPGAAFRCDTSTIASVASCKPVAPDWPMPVSGNTAVGGGGTETRLLTDADGHLQVDLLNSSIAITAASLPLPTGAAQETTLTNVATNTTNLPNVIGTPLSAVPSQLLMLGANNAGNARALTVSADGELFVSVGGGTVNVAFEGESPSTSSGVIDNGTLRVVRASDDPGIAKLTAIDVDTGNIAAGYATEGSALGSGVLLQGDNGANRTNVLVDSDGHLQVDVQNSPSIQEVTEGGVAHDAADTGNPHKVGGQARTSWPTAVANADRANAITDDFGRILTTGVPRALRAIQTTTITSSTSETTIITAGGAGVLNDVYMLLIQNTSATDTSVTIKDSTAGTTRAVIPVKAGQNAGFTLAAADAIPQATANNNWTATCADSVASVYITAAYAKMK